jgi:hypothetical protein
MRIADCIKRIFFLLCLLFMSITLSCDDSGGISTSEIINEDGYSDGEPDEALQLAAKDKYWVKHVPAETSNWINSSMERTADDGFIMNCAVESAASGIDTLIIKLDRNGVIQWQKKFATAGDDIFYSISQSSDGGYFFGGDGFVIKLSADGDAEWSKFYDTGNIIQVEKTGDGGCIAIGSAFIMKLDAQGTFQWIKQIDQGSWNINKKICQTRESGYILLSADESCSPKGGYQTRIRKLDQDGGIEWEKSYENPYRAGYLDESGEEFDASMVMNDIRQAADGGYIVAGETEASPLEQLLYTDLDRDIAIMKIDARGRLQWCKTFGRSLYLVGEICDIGVSVIQTGGGYAVLGESNYSYEKIIDGASETVTVEDSWMWLLKLKGDGTLQWASSYDDDKKSVIPGQLSFIEKADALTDNSYGGFTVLGKSYSYNTSGDILLLNVDAGGKASGTLLDIKRTNAVVKRYYPIVADMKTVFEDGTADEGTALSFELVDACYMIENL